jgi:hypothetical protein
VANNQKLQAALEEARSELLPLRIPWYEIEIAAAQVVSANRNADADELVTLIVNAAVSHWSTGTGY